MRKIWSIILSVLIVLTVVPLSAAAAGAVEECPDYEGDNKNAQNYFTWSSVSNSYLTDDSGLLMRFQADAFEKNYGAAYFDGDYKLVRHIYVEKELPLFGAFYADENNYYILSGQVNYDESDEVEVFRVTKYDKSWNRLGSAGLFGANTYIPFDAGSARIEAYGKYLLIRTCHEMYQSSDGYHHQANVTIQLDTEEMEITDSFYNVMNSSVGYVSHSFNQFVRTDGNKMITVDHGDAYPRAVTLIEYPNDIDSGKFYSWNCGVTKMLEFDGDIGLNYTGASVGGFEISESSYIVAVNNVDMDNFEKSETRNITILVKPKNGGEVTARQVTSYAEGSESASTPQLVKISDTRFILMWSRDDKVYYTELDADGNNGEIYSMKGSLSDCQPIVRNGNVVWYVWDNSVNYFYEINLDNVSENKAYNVTVGHDFEFINATKSNSTVTKQCTKCGHKITYKAPNSLSMYFNSTGEGYYYSYVENSYKTTDKIYLLDSYDGGDEEMQEFSVKIDDKSVLKYDSANWALVPIGEGKANVTFYLTYRPSVKLTYSVIIENSHKLTLKDKKAATYFAKGYSGDKVCTNCGEVLSYGKSTAKLKLKAPSVTYKSGRKKLTVKYNKVKDASGFQLKYTQNGQTRTKTYKAQKTVTKTLKNLQKGSCKVSVRAYIKKNSKTAYSKWTKAKTVKIS